MYKVSTMKIIAYDFDEHWKQLFKLLGLGVFIETTFEASVAAVAGRLSRIAEERRRLFGKQLNAVDLLIQWAEIQEEYGADKFETVEDLARSYKELQRAFSQKSMELAALKRAMKAAQLGKGESKDDSETDTGHN